MTKPVFQPPPIAVEYDCYGKRKTKEFADPYEARQFWISKSKDGKNPNVKKVQYENH